MSKEPTLEEELEEEIERRITIMESDSYEKIPAINKNDVIAMVAVVIVSIAGIIWGLM